MNDKSYDIQISTTTSKGPTRLHFNPLGPLIPKGQMGFFEFWSESHFLDLHPNFFVFRTRAPF